MTLEKEKEVKQFGGSAKETNNKDYLINRESVARSPFTIITDEKGSYVTMGDYRLTEVGTLEEMREIIERKDWEFLTVVIGVLIEKFELFKNK